MKIKIWSLFLATLIFTNSYSEIIKSNTDEIILDFNRNKVIAKDGISLSNGEISSLFYKFERDPKTKEIKFSDNALVNIGQETGNIKIETERGKIFEEEKKGQFYNTFAYINVAKVTGAEAPNDKIYFGSPYIKYDNNKIYANNAWVTTDFNIVNFYKNPKKARYIFETENMLIEPDKQITLYNTKLFVNQKYITPFVFPWFRANIRKNSEVPLFPTFKTSNDYGFETMWGFLYGNRDNRFRGGIAPKFSDKMGFLIGRWENWYKFENFGETQLNINDLLIYSKSKKNYKENEKNTAEYEKINKRYRLELNHNYSGKYGNFDFTSINSTRSMISNLNDVMTKYENNNLYKSSKNSMENNKGKIDRLKFNKNIAFYNLNTKLKNKDTSFSGNMKLVNDKKAYGLLVYDSIKDARNSYSLDHDLYSNFSLKKDNKKIKFIADYNYLYDLDPGSSTQDLMSRNEKFKTNLEHKDSGFSINYQKRKGNDYRNLDFWESDISSTLRQRNILGVNVNYVPKTVSKYKFNNYENFKLNFFKYKLGNYTFTPSVSYDFFEKKLEQVESNFRKENLGSGRISEYNRFFDTLYSKKTERKLGFDLYNTNEIYNINFGNTKEKVISRKGLFNGQSNTYENNSTFYEIAARRKNIESNLGNFTIGGKIRNDQYKNSSDKLNSVTLNLGHKLDITNNLNNNLEIEGNKNLFSGNEANKERRLVNKNNYIQVKNTVDYENKNINSKYIVEYKISKDAYGKKEKNNEYFYNNLNFSLGEYKSIDLNYTQNKRFTGNMNTEFNFNDLKNQDYNIKLNYYKHGFSFEEKNIDFNLKNFNSFGDNAKEKIRQNKFIYSYKFDDSKLSLSYSEGKNKVETTNNKEINRKNSEYSALYNTYGDIEQDFYASYKKYDYGKRNETNNRRNTDVYKFSYAYRDKRFEREELIKYATLEYDKASENISLKDIENIRNILDEKRNFRDSFELTRIEDESFRIGNYKKTFNTYITLEKNNARYSQTGDFKNSLSKIEGGLKYSHNRVGIGYKFKENSAWKNNNWKKENREHELSIFAKIGRPSEGWKIKSYAKLYDNVDQTNSNEHRKKAIDGIGIEIGKEMGYYEWAISYENRYNSSKRDYEWKAGLHFTLLTFPNNSLFGIGSRNNSVKTRPETYLLNRNKLLDKKDF